MGLGLGGCEWKGERGRLSGFVRLGAGCVIMWAMTASVQAQVCGPIPSCVDPECARGRAFGTAVSLAGTDLGFLRTADTGCQTSADQCVLTPFANEFFDASAAGTVVPAPPLINIITSNSHTEGDVRRQGFVTSKSGDAVVQLLPPALPTGSSLLEAVTSGSETTICDASVTATSHVDAVTISGTPVPIPGTQPPNTTIVNPMLNLLVLNEQICPDGSTPAGGCAACAPTAPDVKGCSTRSCTVNALHVRVLDGVAILDIVIASSYAELTTCPAGDAPIADFGASYGGKPGDGALLPYFVAGGTDPNVQDALVTIMHADVDSPPSGEFVHARLFDVNSSEACDVCIPWTPRAVYVESVLNFINRYCGPDGQALLDKGIGAPNDHVFAGYATFEPSQDPGCAFDAPENDFVPHFYEVQLKQGLASGFSGPVFPLAPKGIPPTLRPDFSVYNLRRNDPLYFRLLVGLGDPAGENPNAETRLVVWSDTSGSCRNAAGAAIPDANCLAGTGACGSVIVCDEAENCSSATMPALAKELNIILADDLVPAGFTTGGGWLSLLAKPNRELDAGGLLKGAALRVLGYADNRAIGFGPTRNFEAVFPAQRTRKGACPLP